MLREILAKQFIKSSAVVGTGYVISRVLGMIFFIILARMYIPSDYGFIRYSITIANIAIITALLGFSTALSRYLGKYRGNKDAENLYFSNIIVSILFTSGITIGILSVVLYMVNKMNIGILL